MELAKEQRITVIMGAAILIGDRKNVCVKEKGEVEYHGEKIWEVKRIENETRLLNNNKRSLRYNMPGMNP